MRAMTDAERILGQIQRGEIRADATAARAIAARHEQAYGSVWSRPAPAPAPTVDTSE